jgi:ATP-dependent protease Clp ATPase subunit
VYAHSEGLSGIQLKQMGYFRTAKTNQQYIWLQIVTSWLLTAGMITNLVNRFPVVKSFYEKIDDETKLEIDVLVKILYCN